MLRWPCIIIISLPLSLMVKSVTKYWTVCTIHTTVAVCTVCFIRSTVTMWIGIQTYDSGYLYCLYDCREPSKQTHNIYVQLLLMAWARTIIPLIPCSHNVKELAKNGLHAKPYMCNISPRFILFDTTFDRIYKYHYLNFKFKTEKK
jgi:hypothetical protein